NSLFLLSFVLIASLTLALPLETEQIREKRQMGMFGSPYGNGFGSPYGSMMYQRSVPMMMPVAYTPQMYSPMSMGSLGYGGMGGMGGMTNPSFMAMGFR
ncbi:hypothetical protein PENTCL1PPCAC_17190, partial [Pristionchus entomophagus]